MKIDSQNDFDDALTATPIKETSSGDRDGQTDFLNEIRETSPPHPAVLDRSPYLVNRLLESEDRNLFNHVKFHLLKQELCKLEPAVPKVLDIGCGLQVARKYLDDLETSVDYFGIDYEHRFEPDAVVDLLAPVNLAEELPWSPDVVLMLDVLEHLHESEAMLSAVVSDIVSNLPPQCTVIISLPQMYRLDRFNLSHLHYPEHKIRLTQAQWLSVLEKSLEIRSVQGLGYLSVLPFLPMASKRYRNDNGLGKLFNLLRHRVFEWKPFKPMDLALSNSLGKLGAFKTLSNDIMIVAKPKPRSVSEPSSGPGIKAGLNAGFRPGSGANKM